MNIRENVPKVEALRDLKLCCSCKHCGLLALMNYPVELRGFVGVIKAEQGRFEM